MQGTEDETIGALTNDISLVMPFVLMPEARTFERTLASTMTSFFLFSFFFFFFFIYCVLYFILFIFGLFKILQQSN